LSSSSSFAAGFGADTEDSAELADARHVERAVDVHDGDLARFGGDDQEAAGLPIRALLDHDVGEAARLLGGDDVHPVAGAGHFVAEGAHDFDIVLALLGEFITAHLDGLERLGEIAEALLALLAREPGHHAELLGAQVHDRRFLGLVGQPVEHFEVNTLRAQRQSRGDRQNPARLHWDTSIKSIL
jgi:hypothetical protein